MSALLGQGLPELKARLEDAVLRATGRQVLTLRVQLAGAQLRCVGPPSRRDSGRAVGAGAGKAVEPQSPVSRGALVAVGLWGCLPRTWVSDSYVGAPGLWAGPASEDVVTCGLRNTARGVPTERPFPAPSAGCTRRPRCRT